MTKYCQIDTKFVRVADGRKSIVHSDVVDLIFSRDGLESTITIKNYKTESNQLPGSQIQPSKSTCDKWLRSSIHICNISNVMKVLFILTNF